MHWLAAPVYAGARRVCALRPRLPGVIHAKDAARLDGYREIGTLTALSGNRPKYIGCVPMERVLKQKEG